MESIFNSEKFSKLSPEEKLKLLDSLKSEIKKRVDSQKKKHKRHISDIEELIKEVKAEQELLESVSVPKTKKVNVESLFERETNEDLKRVKRLEKVLIEKEKELNEQSTARNLDEIQNSYEQNKPSSNLNESYKQEDDPVRNLYENQRSHDRNENNSQNNNRMYNKNAEQENKALPYDGTSTRKKFEDYAKKNNPRNSYKN